MVVSAFAPVPLPVLVLDSLAAAVSAFDPPVPLLAVRSIGENNFEGLSPKDIFVEVVDMGVDEGGGGDRRTGEDEEFDVVDVGDMGSNADDKELFRGDEGMVGNCLLLL